MTAPIKIRREHTRDNFFALGGWVTNGHWMIRGSLCTSRCKRSRPYRLLSGKRPTKADADRIVAGVARWPKLSVDRVVTREEATTKCFWNDDAVQAMRLAGKRGDIFVDVLYWNLLSPLLDRCVVVGLDWKRPVIFKDANGRALAAVAPLAWNE